MFRIDKIDAAVIYLVHESSPPDTTYRQRYDYLILYTDLFGMPWCFKMPKSFLTTLRQVIDFINKYNTSQLTAATILSNLFPDYDSAIQPALLDLSKHKLVV